MDVTPLPEKKLIVDKAPLTDALRQIALRAGAAIMDHYHAGV
jgi:hypothetical protein